MQTIKQGTGAMATVCPSCGSESNITDESQAKVFCSNCGLVIVDTLLINDLMYQDQNGVSTVMGNFMSASTSSVARNIAIKNFSKELEVIAAMLNLPMDFVRKASDYYANCLRDKITRGRRNNLLAAALLYIVGRQHNVSHLLIDYADLLNVSIFTLHKYVQPFLRQYKIKLPIQDLESLLPRFIDSVIKEDIAGRFTDNRDCMLFANVHITSVEQLKESVLAVSKYLLKAAVSINIHIGRLPSGLLGACIFITLKMLNYGVPVHRIARCVFCSPDTIMRRLQEMQASQLFTKMTIGSVLQGAELELDDVDVRPPSLVRKSMVYRQPTWSMSPDKAMELGSLVAMSASISSTSITIDPMLATDISFQQYLAPPAIKQARLQLFDAQHGEFYQALQAAREGTVDIDSDDVRSSQSHTRRRDSNRQGVTAAESVRGERSLPISVREGLAQHLEEDASNVFQSDSSVHNAVSSEAEYEYEQEQEARSLWNIFNG